MNFYLTDFIRDFSFEFQKEIKLPFLTLQLESTDEKALMSKYFFECQELFPSGVFFKVILIETKFDQIPQNVLKYSKGTYRAKYFQKGLYLGHHTGPPAIIDVSDNKMILIGTNLDEIMWKYGVKFLLTLAAFENDAIHLKASAFIYKDRIFLLTGRGGVENQHFYLQFAIPEVYMLQIRI